MAAIIVSVSLLPLWLPGATPPEQVLRHHRSAQEQHRRTGSCLLLPSYQHPELHTHGKGIPESLFFKNLPLFPGFFSGMSQGIFHEHAR
jgi:hypothetical protein